MGAFNTPTNIDTTYPDDPADTSVVLHQQLHDTTDLLINMFDTTVLTTRNDGDVLTWDAASSSAKWKPRLYPQRRWDPVTSTWSARPAVPAGVAVFCLSPNQVAATPPTGNVVDDIWIAHPSSTYWP